MLKTLALVLLVMVVGYLILLALTSLYYKWKREEDFDLQYKKDITKEMEETAHDLRTETERFENAKKGK
jgi:hypothetical protein